MPAPYDLPLPDSRGRYKVATYGREGERLQKLVAEKILGTTLIEGRQYYLMKWKDRNDADLVTANDANMLCPQVVIAFYESKIVFKDTCRPFTLVKEEEKSHCRCPSCSVKEENPHSPALPPP